jgi:iron-sulfur cluster assembly protein
MLDLSVTDCYIAWVILYRQAFTLTEKAKMFSVPGLKIITLTDAAAQRVRDIVARSADNAIGLRVGIKKGGCAGMEYTFEIAHDERPGDEIVTDKGAKVFVDGKAVMFLIGTELDFQSSKLSSTFVFKNPNEISACGCGESVSIVPLSSAQAKHLV